MVPERRLVIHQNVKKKANSFVKLKSTYLVELGVRKPLVVSISQRGEELRLYNLV